MLNVVRRGSYPQVELRAADVMTRAIALVPVGLPVDEAAALARHRDTRLLLARIGHGWGGVTPETLERARELGLARVAVGAMLWRLTAVAAGAPEVVVRRRLGPGTPAVVVLEGGRPLGAVLKEAGVGRELPLCVADRLAGLPETTARVIKAARTLGGDLGWPVAAVGGFVRDLLLGRLTGEPELDLAVEGDANVVARRLARALGGRVRQHPPFLTATVLLPDGRRVDVATARRERYSRPGALPAVDPAPLLDDLSRRDFSVNALGLRLDGREYTQVLDPLGGLADLRARRIRVLHPLSFVEDPTRVFRAVRFAERLGFTLEVSTRRLLSAATALPIYQALSGERIRAEWDAVLEEPRPARVLARLGHAGAFRLALPDYRFTPGAAALVRTLAGRERDLPLAFETRRALYSLALTAHLDRERWIAWADRLRLPPSLRAAVARARTEGPRVRAVLARVSEPSDAYVVLRGVPEPTAAWVLVTTRRPAVRRHIDRHLRHWRQVRPLLTGDDLRAVGVVPGPRLGRLLDRLVTAQVAGRVSDRAAAMRWVRQALASADEAETHHPEHGTDPGMRGGQAWRRSMSS